MLTINFCKDNCLFQPKVYHFTGQKTNGWTALAMFLSNIL